MQRQRNTADLHRPAQGGAGLELRMLVNIASFTAVAFWAISVVSLFMPLGLSWPTILIAVLGAPLLFVFVLPALIYNRWGGPSWPTVGAALLLAGLVAAVMIVMWPSVAPLFR